MRSEQRPMQLCAPPARQSHHMRDTIFERRVQADEVFAMCARKPLMRHALPFHDMLRVPLRRAAKMSGSLRYAPLLLYAFALLFFFFARDALYVYGNTRHRHDILPEPNAIIRHVTAFFHRRHPLSPSPLPLLIVDTFSRHHGPHHHHPPHRIVFFKS